MFIGNDTNKAKKVQSLYLGINLHARRVKKLYIGVNDVARLIYQEEVDLPYLTFSSPSAFTVSVGNATKNWDGTLEYSTDDGNTWTEWNGATGIEAGQSGEGYFLYLRGNGNTVITGTSDETKNFVLDGNNIRCQGNILSLLDCTTVSNNQQPTMGEYCFAYLFNNCTALVTAPELPSNTLADSCYKQMFYHCTSLTAAPELPAKNLAASCYYSMFGECSSLTVAPQLPATRLAVSCYATMFYHCISLTAAPELPARNLLARCYTYMFNECWSLKTAPKLPAKSLKNYCYRGMFYNCYSLETIPSLNISYLTAYCCQNMFNNCTKLKVSEASNDEYQNALLPIAHTSETIPNQALTGMYANTGGTFTGTPELNTIYYTSNQVV